MGFRVVVLIAFIVLSEAHPFKLTNCDTTAPLQLNVTKFPSPFHLRNNGTFHLTASIQLKQLLPDDIFVMISVAKKIGFWIRLPCLGCDFGLDCIKVPEICLFRKMCKDCSLGVDNIHITLPHNIEQQIPGFVPNFVLNGDYWLKLRLVDGKNRNKILGCFEIYVTLKG